MHIVCHAAAAQPRITAQAMTWPSLQAVFTTTSLCLVSFAPNKVRLHPTSDSAAPWEAYVMIFSCSLQAQFLS